LGIFSVAAGDQKLQSYTRKETPGRRGRQRVKEWPRSGWKKHCDSLGKNAEEGLRRGGEGCGEGAL
jgi:hypothetical protein